MSGVLISLRFFFFNPLELIFEWYNIRVQFHCSACVYLVKVIFLINTGRILLYAFNVCGREHKLCNIPYLEHLFMCSLPRVLPQNLS